jgi:hypothetical protein
MVFFLKKIVCSAHKEGKKKKYSHIIPMPNLLHQLSSIENSVTGIYILGDKVGDNNVYFATSSTYLIANYIHAVVWNSFLAYYSTKLN